MFTLFSSLFQMKKNSIESKYYRILSKLVFNYLLEQSATIPYDRKQFQFLRLFFILIKIGEILFDLFHLFFQNGQTEKNKIIYFFLFKYSWKSWKFWKTCYDKKNLEYFSKIKRGIKFTLSKSTSRGDLPQAPLFTYPCYPDLK